MKQAQAYSYFNISPTSIATVLAVVIAVLIIFHSAVMVCWSTQACGAAMVPIDRFGYLFDLSREMNIPTWYSVVQLFATACALMVAALLQKKIGSRSSVGWWGLVVIFAYMSMDEATDTHGLWRTGFSDYVIPGTNHAAFAWIIPGVVIVGAVGLVYLRWLFSLPRRTAILFFVAGAVFVTGALVFEGIGAFLADASFFNPSYLVASTIEESLEIYGILIMLYAVLDYLDRQGVQIALRNEAHGSAIIAQAEGVE